MKTPLRSDSTRPKGRIPDELRTWEEQLWRNLGKPSPARFNPPGRAPRKRDGHPDGSH